MNKNKRLFILLVILLVILIIALGASYALFTFNVTKNSNFKVKIGTLELSILDTITEDKFIMENTIPTKDEVALTQNGYTFTLKNTGTIDSYYTIYLDDILLSEGLERLDSSYIKFSLTNQSNNKNITGKLSDYPDREFESAFLNVDESVTYNLKMWVDYEAGNGAQNKYYATQIRVTSIQRNAVTYTESLLNGADPVLSNNLVAVLLADDGTVTKADINNEWYNYGNKNWANAVVLKNQNISYSIGAVIPETNIESYFVWIPKYSYQLWDLGTYTGITSVDSSKIHSIPVRFGLSNTSDTNTGECTTPGVAGSSGNCIVGDYMTHPAFISFDTNGLWVGKYETGYNGATSASTAQVSSSDSSKIVIKPNVYSWRSNTVGNMFKASYDYLRSDESHMMKNTEWGAIAYLSHSNYGINNEIRINNHSSYLTGYAATTADASGSTTANSSYNTTTGYLASTTGNITGIYDMSGGTWEHVMGYTTGASTVGGSSGITSLYSDFYTNSSWKKYYDDYSSTTNTNFSNRILGDATGEMGPFYTSGNNRGSWYSDYACFVESSYPWFHRGGGYNVASYAGTGAFYFNRGTGGSDANYGFRLVLALR